jgi:peptide-methionine (S)-S-oxide reductase
MNCFSFFKTSVKIFLCTISLCFGAEETAIFAGGCFWCTQHDFDQVPGVISTTAGYTGGDVDNPTYEQVSDGGTGHLESVQVTYDSDQVTYNQLLDFYFHNVDPTRDDGQFCDKGPEYRPAIFYVTEEQREEAEQYKESLIASKRFKHVLVQILPAKTFYPAEDYHQEYWKKNPVRYKYYRHRCGRDARLKQLWGSS